MSNKGDKGPRGMIAFCPVCGSSGKKITWDPKTDTCTCACGWSNDPDREKQIEEMAYDICVSRKANYADGCRVCSHHENRCLYQDIACSLYTAGYRKQSEGKWIWINQAKGYLEPPYGDTCKCSLCEFVIDVSESNYNFCPNCGAKMKGGEG